MVVQLATNTVQMCVQNQWAFLKEEVLNGFQSSISRRVNEIRKSIVIYKMPFSFITAICMYVYMSTE